MPSLVVANISTGYSPNHPVLDNLSLRVEDGGRLALVGASGSGKTTLVRELRARLGARCASRVG